MLALMVVAVCYPMTQNQTQNTHSLKTETFTTKEEVVVMVAAVVAVAVAAEEEAVTAVEEDMVGIPFMNSKGLPSIITLSSNSLLTHVTIDFANEEEVAVDTVIEHEIIVMQLQFF